MVKVKILPILCGALLIPGFCAAQPQCSKSTAAAAALPEIILAASVAYRNFDSELRESEKKWRTDGKGESETQRYASDIRNYTIELFAYENKVYVTFTIRPYRGTEFFGGTTKYVLDEKTAAILEHTGEK